ncbi:DUF4190 domain-containing protein [Paenibacillus sp. D2_2]|uniref:DUF4190 domain-containing protein n=1 Tax=Paenibacillus sp. D2_2 TaxID=3073092 RepID=UPI002814D326|nr:DUF4190 domain-containing protein [Paenibacillus sp. D2_2]WMT39969.1 DUF4190 domain-containing protein [Paenibacillus sp. D2_2]
MNQNASDQQYQYSTMNNYPPPYPPGPPVVQKTNGKSIAALVLGILSIMIPYVGFLLGIMAIIFSSLSLKELKRRYEQGKGLAIAGLVCGIIGTIIYGLLLFIILFVFIIYAGSVDNTIYSNF